MFLEEGYVPFDLFRPIFWGDERMHYWYSQNTFLYVRKESSSYAKLKSAGLSELVEIKIVDCIHPNLYEAKAGIVVSFRVHVKDLIPSLLRGIRRRMYY